MYGQTYFTVLFSFPFQQGMEIAKMYRKFGTMCRIKKHRKLVKLKKTLLARDEACGSHGIWLWLPAAAIVPI